MILYHALFGVCPYADTLLGMVGIDKPAVPRFRDCYLNGGHIVIMTRSGATREQSTFADAHRTLEASRHFIRKVKDSFDPTYAYFQYEIPAGCGDACAAMRHLGALRDPHQMFENHRRLLEDPAMAHHPERQRLEELVQPLRAEMDRKIKEAMDRNEPLVMFAAVDDDF
jgi:hypothetical protein